MNELLKAYIEKEKAKQKKERDECLIREGLYEKVYSEKNTCNAEFPHREWDSYERKYRSYRRAPIEITDEEYEEFKKYYEYKKKAEDAEKAAAELSRYSISEEEHKKPNIVAAVLTWMAWIILIGGLILGIELGREEVLVKGYYSSRTTTEFSAALAFTYWIPALIGGISMLGFAEIIKLLEKIKTTTGELSEKIKNK